MPRIALAAAVGAIVVANAAMAHELDVDKDGLISLTEIQDEFPDMTQEEYDALDTNQDDAVDVDEFAAAVESGVLKLPE